MSACPVCLTAAGPCRGVDRRPLPSDHIEREPLSTTPIFAALRAALTATSDDTDGRVRAGGEVAG